MIDDDNEWLSDEYMPLTLIMVMMMINRLPQDWWRVRWWRSWWQFQNSTIPRGEKRAGLQRKPSKRQRNGVSSNMWMVRSDEDNSEEWCLSLSFSTWFSHTCNELKPIKNVMVNISQAISVKSWMEFNCIIWINVKCYCFSNPLFECLFFTHETMLCPVVCVLLSGFCPLCWVPYLNL